MIWVLVVFYLAPFVLADGIRHFPASFLFGASSSAHQVEGGCDVDGKGLNVWNYAVNNNPAIIADGSNADDGPDSYYHFDKDLKIIEELGLNFYRFSISWSRLLPNGDLSKVNKAAIKYYNSIINKLRKKNVEPMVTMHHYDLPQNLQDLGGFTNPLIVDYFKDYAEILFTIFGDRVKLWITFNDPHYYCVDGYGSGATVPFINASGTGEYLCGDHTLKAHAVVYRLYRQKYYKKYGGKVGIVIGSEFFYSRTNNTETANRAMQFRLGWLANPIFNEKGGYPDVMVREIQRNSIKEGLKRSRLPILTKKWKNYLKGAADFLGLNYYTARYVEAVSWTGNFPSIDSDSKVAWSVDKTWKRAKSNWIYSVPSGLRDALRWIKDEYNNTEVFITENGWSDDGELNDKDRIEYLKDHLNAVIDAIDEGCNVAGYSVWSLMDNFEWLMGYTERFGLYFINYTDPSKDRVAKRSAKFYKNVIRTKMLAK